MNSLNCLVPRHRLNTVNTHTYLRVKLSCMQVTVSVGQTDLCRLGARMSILDVSI